MPTSPIGFEQTDIGVSAASLFEIQDTTDETPTHDSILSNASDATTEVRFVYCYYLQL